MSCGASVQVIRRQDWQALDREVRDIMLRVWGVRPVDLGTRIVLTGGPPTAIQRLHDSVEWVRLQTQPHVLQLEAGGGDPTVSLDWLDVFLREHQPHEH